MNGEKNLDLLIAKMEPVLHDGQYIFATVSDVNTIPRDKTICEFKEAEGVTVVMSKNEAEGRGIPFDFVSAWITLNVHSALEAVGLTAAFAKALADHGISCNVIAGYYHDHIFIDFADKDTAMNVLRSLSSNKSP